MQKRKAGAVTLGLSAFKGQASGVPKGFIQKQRPNNWEKQKISKSCHGALGGRSFQELKSEQER